MHCPEETDPRQPAAVKSDKALIFIGRTAGEDQDNVDVPGSCRLTDLEEEMIVKISVQFDKVIRVLNMMKLSWLNEKVLYETKKLWKNGGNGL